MPCGVNLSVTLICGVEATFVMRSVTQCYDAEQAIYTEVTAFHLIVLSGITYQFDGSKPWKNVLPPPSKYNIC